MSELRLEYLDAATLAANPKNWRRHPPNQIAALKGVLAEVGWAGALLYNERTGRLIDGHARKDVTTPGEKVPVLIGSWSEAEEATIQASLDPLAAMATADSEKLDALLREVSVSDEALLSLFSELAEQADSARLSDADGQVSNKRQLGDPLHQVRPVLYVDEIALFERAIRRTGEKNRGKALLEICRAYLEAHPDITDEVGYGPISAEG